MKQLKLKLKNVAKHNATFTIDGKPVKFKKNDFGNYVCNYQTDKESVELHIYKGLELNSKFWWLSAFIFYLISFFGILNPGYDKKCVAIDCKLKLNLVNDVNNVTLTLNNSVNDNKALTYEADCEIVEELNSIYVDKNAKVKRRVLLILKILSWVALAIVLVLLVKNGVLQNLINKIKEIKG